MDLIRETVSVDRFRFKDGKYNLDLTYITPRIIAMAFPAEGVEQLWRNHLDEVISMLTEYHRDHFLILNLSERRWEYSKANYQIFEFGFPDHHPPALFLMFKILLAMDKWLKADPANVVIVHCKGGKGRTGTVIASYLLYSRAQPNPEKALDFFATRRSADAKGVEQASQRRYVHYCNRVLLENQPPKISPIKLSRVIVTEVPKYKGQDCRLFIQIKNVPSYEVIFYTHNVAYERVPEVSDCTVKFDMANSNVMLEGDILMEFHHQIEYKRSKLLWSFYFHTAFIDGYTLFLGKDEVDSLKKENEKLYADIGPDFMINLIFEDISGLMKVDQLKENSSAHETTTICRAALYHRNTPQSASPDSQTIVLSTNSSASGAAAKPSPHQKTSSSSTLNAGTSSRVTTSSSSGSNISNSSQSNIVVGSTSTPPVLLSRSSLSEIAMRINSNGINNSRRAISPLPSPLARSSSPTSAASSRNNSNLTVNNNNSTAASSGSSTLRRPATPLPLVPQQQQIGASAANTNSPVKASRSETVNSYLSRSSASNNSSPRSSPLRKPTSPLPEVPSASSSSRSSSTGNSLTFLNHANLQTLSPSTAADPNLRLLSITGNAEFSTSAGNLSARGTARSSPRSSSSSASLKPPAAPLPPIPKPMAFVTPVLSSDAARTAPLRASSNSSPAPVIDSNGDSSSNSLSPSMRREKKEKKKEKKKKKKNTKDPGDPFERI